MNYSRLIMPLALSRGILLRPRSERVETQLSLFVSMEAHGSVYVLTNCSTAWGIFDNICRLEEVIDTPVSRENDKLN